MVALAGTIFRLSLMGSVAAVFIMLVKLAVRDKFSAKWHYMIWFLLVLRLILPFSVPSSLSIYNILPDKTYMTDQTSGQKPEEYQSDVNNTGHLQQVQHKDVEVPYVPQGEKLKELDTVEYSGSNKGAYEKEAVNWWHVASVIWLSGMLLFLAFFLASYIHIHRRLSLIDLCTDPNMLRLIDWCRKEAGVKKAVKVYYNDRFDTPCVFGLFRPSIILPVGLFYRLDETTRKHVVLHEMMHIKRKDYFVNIVILVLQSMHWFNPVLWYAFLKMRKDCETACDERVLERLEREEHRGYALSLLSMAGVQNKVSFYNTVLAFGESNIKGRVCSIMSFKKLSGRAIIIAGVVLTLISVMLLTNAVKSERELLTMDFKRVASAEISLKTSGEDMLISLSATEHGDYIKELYSSVLTDTGNVKSFMNPKEMYSQNSEPVFSIVFNYDNGESEKILSTESGMFIFRFIDSKGSWVGGSNDKLLPIINKISYDDDENTTLSDNTDLSESAEEKRIGETVESLLKTIMETGPMSSSNPYDYVKDSKVFEELVAMGDPAMEYMLDEFSKSNANTLKEHIMAMACQKILGQWDDKLPLSISGREWYYKIGAFIKYGSNQVYDLDEHKKEGYSGQIDRTDLEQVISQFIHEKNKGSYNAEKSIEAHKTYGTEEKDGLVYAYMHVVFSRFAFENGYFTTVSEMASPVVITLQKSPSGEYTPIEYKRTSDGKGYYPSINEMFPEHLVDRVINEDNSELRDIKIEKARQYLESIGRKDAPIVLEESTSRFSDDEEKRKALYMVNLMRKDFPDWEGSREILVNVGGKPPGLAVRVLLETTAEKINKDVYVVKLTKVWDIEIGGKQPVSTWTYKVSGDKVELIGYEDNDDMVEIIK